MADATLGQVRKYFSLDIEGEDKVPMEELKHCSKADRDELKTLLGAELERDPKLAALLEEGE